MKFKSLVYSAVSGSVGGLTYAHNRGGMYTRARAIPSNPNSTFQQAVRGFMGQLSDAWVNTLTLLQRAEWIVYAENVPLVNRLGDEANVTGLNQYVRSNVPRLQAGLPRVDDAPTTFTIGSFTNPSVASDQPNNEVDVSFTNTDEWANEDDSALLVFVSRPQNPSINYFKGPYQFAGSILGDATTPPTSPAAIAVPFTFGVGSKLFVKVSASRADGRLSYPFRDFLIAT